MGPSVGEIPFPVADAIRQPAAASDYREVAGPLTGGNWLSLWRDPVDVVASQLYNPPRWSGMYPELSAPGDDPDARKSQIEFYATMWCQHAEAFIASSQSQCLFSYDQLTSDPRGMLDAVPTLSYHGSIRLCAK
jgi:hypothetical protein